MNWTEDAEGLTRTTPLIEMGVYAGWVWIMTTVLVVQTSVDPSAVASSYSDSNALNKVVGFFSGKKSQESLQTESDQDLLTF